VPLPLLDRLGRRKSWIVLCQAVLIARLRRPRRDRSEAANRHLRPVRGDRGARLGDPGHRHRRLADRRRRREDAGRIALAIYQFGYRIASIVGGALALVLAARMSWPPSIC
jgi:PAT family beta-lactamase induction signal transducer AmpG